MDGLDWFWLSGRSSGTSAINEWTKQILIWFVNGLLAMGVVNDEIGFALLLNGGLVAAGRQWLRQKKQTKAKTNWFMKQQGAPGQPTNEIKKRSQ